MRFTSLLISLLLLGSLATAQNTAPFIHSIEVEYQHAIFDPAGGMAVKANHLWRQEGRVQLQSGVLLSGHLRPGASPLTTGINEEFNATSRLLLHTGYLWNLGKKQRWKPFVEGFIGLRAYFISGTLNQASQGFERSYSQNTFRGDWGLRFGSGFKLTDRLDAQLSLTSSLINIQHPLGFWIGWLFWGPDALSMVGIGLKYRLGE
ncbi:MAG: hypothetical protein AAF399_22455 [Bacteroidota bacterium]